MEGSNPSSMESPDEDSLSSFEDLPDDNSFSSSPEVFEDSELSFVLFDDLTALTTLDDLSKYFWLDVFLKVLSDFLILFFYVSTGCCSLLESLLDSTESLGLDPLESSKSESVLESFDELIDSRFLSTSLAFCDLRFYKI